MLLSAWKGSFTHTASICVFEQAEIDREELALPWRHAGLELVRYGGVMLQLKSDDGYILTFTPQSNEFTIKLLSSTMKDQTAGLCGNRNIDPLSPCQQPTLCCFNKCKTCRHLSSLFITRCVIILCLPTRCLRQGDGQRSLFT